LTAAGAAGERAAPDMLSKLESQWLRLAAALTDLVPGQLIRGKLILAHRCQKRRWARLSAEAFASAVKPRQARVPLP